MRVLLSILVLVVAAAGLRAADAAGDDAIREAIVAAVQARMGDAAEVEVAALEVQGGWDHADVLARPDPNAKLGGATRFSLGTVADTPGATVRWVGAAEAELRVRVPHLHTRRAVARGAVIGADDVELVEHEVTGALRAWPGEDAIDRTRALRSVEAGTCLSQSSLQKVPIVRPGQEVQALVRIGAVVAEARLVAAESGDEGSVIRVVNPESRRSLKARVVGPGVVEVIHE
ncbi:MAG: flagellar basal body P-ring formation chaperone FlgA [Vicinamibacterales bacterium]